MAIVGIFDSVRAAEGARTALIRSGVDSRSIALSIDLTADPIAAEAPGQSYERQSYDSDEDEPESGRYGTLVRSGGCALTVENASGDEAKLIEDLLRQRGARSVSPRSGP